MPHDSHWPLARLDRFWDESHEGPRPVTPRPELEYWAFGA